MLQFVPQGLSEEEGASIDLPGLKSTRRLVKGLGPSGPRSTASPFDYGVRERLFRAEKLGNSHIEIETNK